MQHSIDNHATVWITLIAVSAVRRRRGVIASASFTALGR
jgi:hypothetical protein